MIKPKLDMGNLSDGNLLTLATGIKNAMTTNAAEFPNSAASVTALGTAVTAFTASRQAAEDGKITQQALVDAKDADRVTVEDCLRTLAGQVNEVAQGDVNIIHDAGMQASAERAPITMTQVMNLAVSAGDEVGELDLQWDPIRGARIYKVQVSSDTVSPPANWTDKATPTKSKVTLTGLPSATKVWVRVKAVGANDEGAWSDVAWKTVP
jgi:hypothetical protein